MGYPEHGLVLTAALGDVVANPFYGRICHNQVEDICILPPDCDSAHAVFYVLLL